MTRSETRDWQRYVDRKGRAIEPSPEAVASALRDPVWTRVTMAPTAEADFRRLRPYFLVPLLDAAFPGEQGALQREIAGYLSANPGITDLFVLSHGWHRNIVSGVAAYDRLVSRFGTLLSRGRLQVDRPFLPLFLALHWNSDPSEDLWVDRSGRRHKDDFIERAQRLFVPGPGRNEADFLTLFEDLFQAMSRMCTPGTDAFDPAGCPDAARLT